MQQRQADDRMDELLQLLELLPCLGFTAPDHRKDAGHDLQIIAVSAVSGKAPFQVRIEGLCILDRLMRSENDLGCSCRKFLAGFRRPGLHQNRMALRCA